MIRNDEERGKITNCLRGSTGLEDEIEGIRGDREENMFKRDLTIEGRAGSI